MWGMMERHENNIPQESPGEVRKRRQPCSELTRRMNLRHKSQQYVGSWAGGSSKTSCLYPERREVEVTLIKLVAYENGVMPTGRMWQGFINLFPFTALREWLFNIPLLFVATSLFPSVYRPTRPFVCQDQCPIPHLDTVTSIHPHCKFLLASSKADPPMFYIQLAFLFFHPSLFYCANFHQRTLPEPKLLLKVEQEKFIQVRRCLPLQHHHRCLRYRRQIYSSWRNRKLNTNSKVLKVQSHEYIEESKWCDLLHSLIGVNCVCIIVCQHWNFSVGWLIMVHVYFKCTQSLAGSIRVQTGVMTLN